jgi:hypothetical protein
MLGHACKMLAVMYLQPELGPPIAENESTTHRMHRMHRMHRTPMQCSLSNRRSIRQLTIVQTTISCTCNTNTLTKPTLEGSRLAAGPRRRKLPHWLKQDAASQPKKDSCKVKANFSSHSKGMTVSVSHLRDLNHPIPVDSTDDKDNNDHRHASTHGHMRCETRH